MNQLLLQYSYLQVLDLMTTVAFLMQGLREGNPLVRLALEVTPNPLAGLLLVKMLAIILGIYCWRLGRNRLLMRINLLFAVLVVWNLLVLILAPMLLKSA
ncbi:MAG: DUF5658 family protein [Bryobacteraceae bacterium]